MAMRDERGDSRSARELEAQLQSIVRRNAGLVSAIRLQCASEDEQPAGYMGINFEGIGVQKKGGGPALYLFERPMIVSVEPGSPAQRAGLEPEDLVIAIGGNDVHKPIPLGSLLQPGKTLSLRVNRDGKPREFTLQIAKRPDGYGSPCAGVDDVVSGFRFSPQTTFMRRSEGGTMAGAQPRSPNPDAAIATPQGFGYAFVTPYATGPGNLVGGPRLLCSPPTGVRRSGWIVDCS